MKRILVAVVLCASLLLRGADETKTVKSDEAAPRPLIQMAILLDTSGSMNGLIDQARGQLWTIVNEFIGASREGKKPELQVALYEYGKRAIAEDGHIRQIVPLTTDLDKISQELFALKTNGGDEYCGWVIKTAVEQLAWSKSNSDLKVIFIAGNEPFTQGPVDYRTSCKSAIEKGIIVNTIHCGTEAQGITDKWEDGAKLADGKYSFINQNKAVVRIDAPQDQEIAKLNEELNKTYIAFGVRGKEAAARQVEQDKNAAKMDAQAAGQRAATKASANYRNESWDLVDALKDGKKQLKELKDEEVPEEMKKLTAEQRQAFVEEKTKARGEIQKKILELNDERNKYVEGEMKKRAADEKGESLDKVVAKAAREQAKQKNFEFSK